MTEEQKELLLKDLCDRLPYGVKLNFNYIITSPAILKGINKDFIECDIAACELEDVKPYLFPISSITKEQRNEFPFELSLLHAFINGYISLFEDEELSVDDIIRMMDCLNKNHIDYRGLIPLGLAIDCTNLNIYRLYEHNDT